MVRHSDRAEFIIDECLAEFIGIFIGDGSLFIRKHKHDYDFKIVGNPYDEKEYYVHVSWLLMHVLNRTVTPRLHDAGRSYGVRFCSKSLAKQIAKLGIITKLKSHNAIIPIIFLENFSLMRACLRGLFDTDGCLTIKKQYYPVVTFVSANSKLVLQVANALRKLGIPCSTSYNQKRYDKRTFNLSIRNEVNINGFRNVRRFYTIIGSNNPKMINKYKERVEVAGSGFEPPICAQT